MDVVDFRFWASLVAVAMVAGVDVCYPWIERRAGDHLHRLVALTGGVALGYVSLYMLPKIGDYTAGRVADQPELPELFQYGLYLYFLGGLVLYYFLERAEGNQHPLPVWLHAAAFAVYSFATGYVLADVPRPEYFPYILAGMALSLHFVGICHQLRTWHPIAFDRHLRWLLGVAVVAGWIAGTVGVVPKSVLAAVVAFLGGGILVNVLREEWPHGGSGRTLPFLIGIALFVGLMVIIRGFTGDRN